MRLLIFIFLGISSFFATAQTTVITGKVTGEDGEALIGSTVAVQGTTRGSIADFNGEFRLELNPGDSLLEVSYVGYQTQIIAVGNQTYFELILPLDVSELQEVIVVGYGTTIKQDLTGNISKVSGEEISSRPVNTFESAIQGRATGVFIQGTSGKLGERINVRVRGTSSLSASNQPLYVIDGIPMTSESQTSSINAGSNPLIDINPNDIQSVEILKDASAAAIYGSRAANGVILITTKKGEAGKMKFDFDYQVGVAQTPEKLDMYSTEQYRIQDLEAQLRIAISNPLIQFDESTITPENLKLWLEAGDETTSIVPTADGTLEFPDQFRFNTDWQDEVFQTGIQHRANFSLSGGSDNTNYYGSFSYNNSEGILIGNQLERFTARANINSDLSNRLSVNGGINYTRTNNDRLFEDSQLNSPLQVLTNSPGDTFDEETKELIVQSEIDNPLNLAEFSDNTSNSNRFIGNTDLSYEIVGGLKFTTEFGLDFIDQREEIFEETVFRDNDGSVVRFPNNAIIREVDVFNYTTNNYFSYDNIIQDNHIINGVVGFSYQESSSDLILKTNQEGLNLSELEGEPEDMNVEDPIGFSFLSYFGRVNYSFKHRYIAQISGRVDGSSKFGSNNRYGFFPAVSLGWNIAEEPFLSSSASVSLLKFKASYGLVGNDPAEANLFETIYIPAGFGNEDGIRASNLPNPDLKWETTAQLGIGIEYSLFKNRLSGSFDYYRKDTEDLLFPTPITSTSGFPFVLKNIGESTNEGFEIALDGTIIQGEDFQWNSSFNITFNSNEITNINGEQVTSGINAFIEGEPIGVFFMRKFAGVDPETGLALYDDGQGGTTDDFFEAPRMVVGDPNPDYFGGFNNSFSYKNFELSFLFQFVGGNEVYNRTGELISNSGLQFFNQTDDQANRWYRPGDQTDIPGMDPFASLADIETSTRWLEDGSYIRLKTLNFSYSLPERIVSNWGLRYFTINVGGFNLWTLTDYPGYDPEVSFVFPEGGVSEVNLSQGIDDFTTPPARIITSGIKIGF